MQESASGGRINWKLFICATMLEVHRKLHIICEITFIISCLLCYCLLSYPFLNYSVMSSSVLFLAATIFVYVYVESIRADAAGKSLLCFLSSFLMVYACLPSRHFKAYLRLQPFVNILMNCSQVFAFIWLSVLSFDIWWTFQ